MKLLEETIRELKGEDLEDDVRATVNLRIDFRIDESYVPDMNQRLMIYRRIAAARSEDELGRLMEEVRDRYGPPPTAVLNLADYGRIRVLADGLGVETIEREGSTVVIRFRREGQGRSDAASSRWCSERGDLQLIPPVSLKLDLQDQAPAQPASGITAQAKSRSSTQAAEVAKARRYAKIQRKPAWWTARATAGEVTPGFSKAEILKQAPEDPRAPGRNP